jgi:predicted NAD/FAD-dependent oxidoreductase
MSLVDEDHSTLIGTMFRTMYNIAKHDFEGEDMMHKVEKKMLSQTPFIDLITRRERDILSWILRCHELWLGTSLNNVQVQEWLAMAPHHEHFKKELNESKANSDWGEYNGFHSIIENGLGKQILQMADGLNIKLLHRVRNISSDDVQNQVQNNAQQYQDYSISVSVQIADGSILKYKARKCLVTLPLSVLAHHASSLFEPSLSADKLRALSEVEMSNYMKVFLSFNEIFWDQSCTWIGKADAGQSLSDPFVLFFNYYRYTQQPILIAFAYGDTAHAFDKITNDQVIADIAITSLQSIFDIPLQELKKKMDGVHITHWGTDVDSLGSYPFGSPNEFDILRQPHGNVHFAGDGMVVDGHEGSVAAAFKSGLYEAERIAKLLLQSTNLDTE